MPKRTHIQVIKSPEESWGNGIQTNDRRYSQNEIPKDISASIFKNKFPRETRSTSNNRGKFSFHEFKRMRCLEIGASQHVLFESMSRRI